VSGDVQTRRDVRAGSDLYRARDGRDAIAVTPATAGWDHLAFHVHALRPGERLDLGTDGVESAIVPISGAGVAEVDGEAYELARAGIFTEMGGLLYVPPGVTLRLTASADWIVAVGTAPAVGRHPVRLIAPGEAQVELRGGGAARRQVNHLLAPPLPAERLIVYEVYVPAGEWAGWPPHRHDGVDGSSYLEESYLFRFDRSDGFGFHRSYAPEAGFDETFAVHDGDCVAVPRGYHVTGSTPGSNMWILNFLAGELIDDARATPPAFDPATTWITQDWDAAQVALPVGGTR
jgi:5-deoxy-glucuronate isomerase